MPFVTKVDYSDNRQVKQFQLTNTALSGTTTFGLDFSGLTSGVDQTTVSTTGSYAGVSSTFSGNTGTTIFVFGQPEMNVGADTLEPITSSNSGDTQVGLGYEGINPVVLDGNTIYTSYTGSTYDLYVTAIVETGPNTWSGTVQSDTVTLLSGDSSDYSDRTIWVDVKGITKTKRLILEDEVDFNNNADLLGRDANGNLVRVIPSGFTADLTGFFIPLSGTSVGSPVTGDIEFEDWPGRSIYQSGGTSNQVKLDFVDATDIILSWNNASYTTTYAINNTTSSVLSSTNPNFLGILGSAYWGSGYTDNHFVQKKYVDDEINSISIGTGLTQYYIPLSGTSDGFPVTGDIEIDGSDPSTHQIFKDNVGDDTNMSLQFQDNLIVIRSEGIIDSTNKGEVAINNGSVQFVAASSLDPTVSLNVSTSGMFLTASATTFGIRGSQYYGANYTDNTYVQKLYVDTEISAATSGLTQVTGFTYTPTTNTFTIERANDVDLSAFFDTVSGLTVTNELSAYNISATTINPVDYIQFNTGYTGNTVVEGRMYWDEDNQTISVGLHTVNGDVSMQLGQELYYLIKNQSGSTINDGRVVRAAGTLGSSGKILGEYMIADGTIEEKYTLGIATQNIPNGEDGYVTEFGIVRGIDTTGTPYGETWNDGDILWVSPTISGGLTNVEPLPPNLKIEMAIVVHANANGSIFVRPNRYPHVHDLQEMLFSGGTESNLDIMQWNEPLSGWSLTNTPTFNSVSAATISATTIYSGGTDLATLLGSGTHPVSAATTPIDSYYGDRIVPTTSVEGFLVETNANLATGYFIENVNTGNAAYAGFVAKGSGSNYFDNVTSLQHFGDNYFLSYLQNKGVIYSTNDLYFLSSKNTGSINFRLGTLSGSSLAEGDTDSVLELTVDREVIAPSLTVDIINAETTGKSLITKEWATEENIYGTRVTQSGVTGTYTIEWSAGTVFELFLTGNTTFQDNNLPTSANTRVIELVVTGDHAITLPSYWDGFPNNDVYDGTVRNHFILSCINGNASSEDVLYSIENLST